MVRLGRDFMVFDAKSGEDITRSVLTQIIVEEESKGRSLLPERFLRQLIGFYGDSLQTVLPRYLEFAMAGFARQQEQMRRSVEQAMGGFMPFGGSGPGGGRQAEHGDAGTRHEPVRAVPSAGDAADHGVAEGRGRIAAAPAGRGDTNQTRVPRARREFPGSRFHHAFVTRRGGTPAMPRHSVG